MCNKRFQHIRNLNRIVRVSFKKMCKHIAYTSIQLMGIDQYHLQLSFIGKAKIRVFCNDKVIKEPDVKIFSSFFKFFGQ